MDTQPIQPTQPVQPPDNQGVNNSNQTAANSSAQFAQPNPTQSQPTAPHKKNNKKTIIIIVAILGALVGLILMVVVAFFVFNRLTGVSKAEYREAYTDASNAAIKLGELQSSVSGIVYSYNPTETQQKNKLDTANKAITEYKDTVAKLANAKAVKNGEQAKLYKTFKEKNDKYVSMTESYIKSSSAVAGPMSLCVTTINSSLSNLTNLSNVLEQCIIRLNAVQGVEDSDLKAGLDATNAYVTEVKNLAQQYANIPSTSFSQRYDISDKMYASGKAYNTKIDDIESNIEKKFKDSDPFDQINALSSGLLKQTLNN